MILFPAIDLKEGLCVRLEQGDMTRAKIFNHDPAAQAYVFESQGFEYLHVVDLDGAAVVASLRWDFSAKVVPLVVGTVALCAAALSLFNDMCRKPAAAATEGLAEHAQHEVGEKIHMDLTSDTGHLPVREIALRAALFFGYLIGFMAMMAVIGLIPTVGLFVVFFMRYEARERWPLVIPYAAVLVVFIWFAFDYFMAVPWPPTLIGQWFPMLKAIPSV